MNRNSYLLLGRYIRFGLAFHIVCGCPLTISLAVLYPYVGKGHDLVFIAATLVVLTPLFLRSIFNWTMPLHRLQRIENSAAGGGRPGCGVRE